MAISQTCTFMHDVVAYLYSIKTTLDFSSTLTIYPTYQNDIRGKKRFIKTTFINLPDHTILSILHKHTNTQHIFLFHLPPWFKLFDKLHTYFALYLSPLNGGHALGTVEALHINYYTYVHSINTNHIYIEILRLIQYFAHSRRPLKINFSHQLYSMFTIHFSLFPTSYRHTIPNQRKTHTTSLCAHIPIPIYVHICHLKF